MKPWIRIAAVVAAAVIAAAASASAPAHAGADIACETVTVPVKPVNSARTFTVAGTYCAPSHTPDTVYVAVPGASYNHWYWDPTYKPGTYSFARQAAELGDAVFAIDRLGGGGSSRPLSLSVTASLQAEVIARVTDKVSDNYLGDRHGPVILIGHSMGSVESLMAIADHDAAVSGFIMTGLNHKPNAVKMAEFLTVHSHPAALDPAFDIRLDAGWMTTRPGVRDKAFHQPGDAEAGMLTADEDNKDIYSINEFPDSVALVLILKRASRIAVPVVVAMGAADSIFCGKLAQDCSSSSALAAAEKPHFAAAPCVAGLSVPEVGHNLSLHPTAPDTHAALLGWGDAVAAGGCPARV